MSPSLRLPKRAATFVLVVSLSGCVTLGTHEELVDAHKETQTRLAQEQLGNAALRRQLDDERDRSSSLAEALAAEQRRAATLDVERLQLTERLASAEARERSTQTELASTQGELAQLVKDRSALKGSVEGMKQALDELARRRAEADGRIAEYKAMLARFQPLIDGGTLKVKIVDGRMVVALSSDVLFSSGSAALSKDGKANLTEVGRLLAQIPDRRFQVEGHTDNVPIRTDAFPSNWELASARSLTVLKSLVDGGLPGARVSAASFGAEKPAASNDTLEGRAQNRRIEIVVVPDLSSLPGFDELARAAQ